MFFVFFLPVLTAPVLPKQIFATVPIHVPSFVYLLETQVRGQTAICGRRREKAQKHINMAARTHKITHIQNECMHSVLCDHLMETRWRPLLFCVAPVVLQRLSREALSQREYGHCPITVTNSVTC